MPETFETSPQPPHLTYSFYLENEMDGRDLWA